MMNSFFAKYCLWYPLLVLRDINYFKYKRVHEENKRRSPDELKRNQLIQFKRTLSLAYHNIPFYKEKYDKEGLHPTDVRELEDIKKVPLLDKKEIIENGDGIYNSKYTGKKNRRSTSGSTGSPFVFYKDPMSMSIMDIVLYENYSSLGIDIGDKQGKFWGLPLDAKKRSIALVTDLLANRVRFSAFQLDNAAFRKYLKKLFRYRTDYLYGYSQSIFQFANFFWKKGICLSKLRLKGIILTGEMIFPNQIEMIHNVFGCPVSIEYGCTEVGVIAFSCTNGKMHLMNNLLTETVEPFDDGIGQIVVSELYGELFPFIRYKIGDRGSIEKKRCSCGGHFNLLTNLKGRLDDFIRCKDGKLVDAYVVEYIIDQMPKRYGMVKRFLIVQDSIDHLEIRMKMYNQSVGGQQQATIYLVDMLYKVLPRSMVISISSEKPFEKSTSGKNSCFISKIGG